MRRSHPVAAALLVFSIVAVASQDLYKVERVIDGDTVVLTGLGSVRLIGVDTPETVDPRKPVEAFGREASAFLTGFLAGRSVRVSYDQTLKDRFNRTLAYLHLEDGTFVNREIVRLGYGHAYVEFPFKFMDDFRAAQREAREANRGLWAIPLLDVTTIESPSPAKPASGPVAAGLLSAAQGAATAIGSTTVYLSRTGEKYHRRDCRTLTYEPTPIQLRIAVARYGACGICKPPGLQ